jgi:hypothetical protein
LTNEIFYCARCRRVILPREIAEGRYHIVDGDSVCSECFTRLSRRLRSMGGSLEKPKPVDLADVPAVPLAPEPKEPSPAPEAEAEAEAEAVPRLASSRGVGKPTLRGRLLIPAGFFLLGLVAGAVAYLVLRSRAEASGASPAAPASSGQRR